MAYHVIVEHLFLLDSYTFISGMSFYFMVHSKCIFFIIKFYLCVLNNSSLLNILLQLFYTNLLPIPSREMVLTNDICFIDPISTTVSLQRTLKVEDFGPARCFR